MRLLGHFGDLPPDGLGGLMLRLEKGAGSNHESSERLGMTWEWSSFSKGDYV
jgi:hypothetical protein